MPICGLLALTALVVALAASGGATRSAEAAFPGANGKIAFVKAFQVWVANGDGSDPRR